eukprot:gb/GFBE01033924.1/.p1 GENE.gb/GFBE01033924.1/~~gb/GFBE01033924.1/.p1  ORF type:complete len:234 (+),score=44.25 gb/GFBE01033924.1/:1-702(+)
MTRSLPTGPRSQRQAHVVGFALLLLVSSWTISTCFSAASRVRKTNATAMRAGEASVLDNLQKLPDLFGDAFAEAQDLFGGGSGELEPMPVSSIDMAADGLPKNGLIQSMTLRASAGSERRLARQVGKVVAAARTDPLVLSATASQNKEDPCDFTILLRYASMDRMSSHQSGPAFKSLLEAMEAQLEKPIGLYLVDEQLGQIGMARHPFGPGGEGGRDDAIYSSRVRADGSDAR